MINNVKVSPLVKTIRFEARPVWETAIHAKAFSGMDSKDAVRKLNYGNVKQVLNNYARFVIENATALLVSENLSASYEDLRNLYVASRNRKDKDTVKRYEKAVKDFKSHVVDVLRTYGAEKQLIKSQGDLFSDKKSLLLNDMTCFKISDDEKNMLRMYQGFAGYFSRYFNSLSKTIFCGMESGSIANRIVQNMEKYFQNEKLISEIKEEHPSLYQEIKSSVDAMNVSFCMSQERIDYYNSLLGNVEGCGINSLINEYRQKNKIRVAGLKFLDKIPLCRETKQIVVHSIENEQELCSVVLESLSLVEDLLSFSKSVLHLRFSDEELKCIYVRKSFLSKISQDVYGRWDTLQKAVDSYCAVHEMEQPETFSLYLLKESMRYYDENSGATFSKCSVVDSVKEKLSEAVSVKKDIPTMEQFCLEGNPLSHKKEIKSFYEKVLLVGQAVRIFDLEQIEHCFIENLVSMQDTIKEMISVFNMVRSFCTKSPIDESSFPLYFDKSSCLSSLDYDKFLDGVSISSILRKDGHYYLLILNPKSSAKLPLDAKTQEGGYEQLVYKQLTGLNKMFPKVFMAKANQDWYSPSEEIQKIVREKLYTKEAGDRDSCVKWIRFCIESFKKNEEWMKNFNISFKSPEEYASANEFYTEVEKRTIRMDFSERIDEKFLRRAVEAGDVFLFELYNRDFSPYHRGKDGSFTRIFKEMFSDDNLYKLNCTDETAVKLASGGSQLTFRKASLPYKETHPANVAVKNKNPLNEKRESVFSYSLCKDKRFMTDKYFLSLAVQIGFRNQDVSRFDLNQAVNKEVLKESPNVLTVRVGERHLLYYIVIDPCGCILEQKSLNVIRTKNGNQVIETNYKELLIRREQEINEEKEKWNYSKDIKKIKEGYLSLAVHEILALREKYNAVIFLEDYNGSFFQKRQKNLKTVYQQFQRMLLQRLSCYVPDGKDYCDAIQLACPVSGFEDLKGQSGVVYFVNTSYTSNVDPFSGFVNQYNDAFRYESIQKAKNTVSNITDIRFNENEREFEIVIPEKAFGAFSLEDKVWTLHTKGSRTVYKDKKYIDFDCTEEMKSLFDEYKVTCLEDILSKELKKNFYERLFEIVQVLLRMHYYSPELDEDYFLSPVIDKYGSYNDSRMKKEGFPTNSTAVKTWIVMRKGLRNLQRINKETFLVERDEKGSYKENWISFLRQGL